MFKCLYVVFIFAFLLSCTSKQIITYSYNGVTIKRVDYDSKTIFYYNDKDKRTVCIYAKYSGINDGFSGYLKYNNDNKKVLLLSGDGYFQTTNKDNLKFEYKRVHKPLDIVIDSTTYRIKLSTRYEREDSININSKVKAIYEER